MQFLNFLHSFEAAIKRSICNTSSEEFLNINQPGKTSKRICKQNSFKNHVANEKGQVYTQYSDNDVLYNSDDDISTKSNEEICELNTPTEVRDFIDDFLLDNQEISLTGHIEINEIQNCASSSYYENNLLSAPSSILLDKFKDSLCSKNIDNEFEIAGTGISDPIKDEDDVLTLLNFSSPKNVTSNLI
ncbi:hypothetical protein TUBRATIS_24600 [Tubulinosema ratisbonensis]|uniref:Uncharacterized protein n=1 Tax=Tubulinosema ratisbonensis TaxID=291195 RepID=A0A437AIV7_9MICR|nr:hypothetical protein TUBRATIS_24600 [Tubulinosema ratisbonensis]